AVYLTENTSSFFGVPPLLGRDIQPSDAADSSGHPSNQIAVLNYRFWQSHYNGDPSVLGRTLQLDHKNYTIVGVMPRAFAFSNMTGTGDVYLPRSLLRDTASPPVHWPWTPLIKLKPGVSAAQADAELQTVVEQFARENPEHYPKKFQLRLQPIAAPFAEKSGRTLGLLFAAVVMLLIIGCANCSILLLARGAARQHELAVRSAIGASRWRIVRQLLVESAMLVLAGSIAGAALAWFLAKLPLQLSPASFPPEAVIRVNQPVLGFAVALAVIVSLLIGLAPALRLSRPDVSQMAQKTSQRTNTRHGKSSYQILIASQIALTLVLMAVAGAAATAFLKLTRTSLGYDPHHVMQVGIVMHWTDPQDWGRIRSRDGRAAFIEEIRQKIAAIPGVLSASVGTDATPPTSGEERAFEISGNPSSADEANPDRHARVIRVSPEYFSTLRISLLGGRIWDAAENQRGDSVAVINRAMAQRNWPGGNALGQQIRIPGLKSTAPLVSASPGSADWRQVIGIVGDARNNGVGSPVEPAIYLPYTTLMEPFAQFQIRTQGEPLALLRQVRTAVESVSADQQVANGTVDLEQALSLDPEWSRERLFSVLFGIFSALALALALVGLYSVVSYSVAQRTNEFG
ncbi:MAG TPA: ABC transporter permease, partial [Acidobacteriaceae bacterium]